MAAKRAAIATVVLALIGLLIAANLAYLHAQLKVGAGYTSWCAINSEVNCDVVLTSEYASFLGVPIAYLALLTYVGIAAAAAAVLRSPRASRRRQLATGLFAVSVWSVVFSLYLLYVSLFILGALYLRWVGLYIVNLIRLVCTAMLFPSLRVAACGR